MFCAISGEVPQEPVVSRSGGHLFEKRLVEKYIAETGKCPITNEDMSEEDLVTLQVNKAVKPRPVSSTSIPGMIAAFQNEWDEMMQETFTLKQSLDATRQELAQALYQHDAACRVIARLMKERDEARAALANLESAGGFNAAKAGGGGGTNGHAYAGATTAMDTDADTEADGAAAAEDGAEAAGGLGTEVIDKINDKCKELSTWRRGRKFAPEGVLSKEVIGSLSTSASYTPHTAAKGQLCGLDVASGAGGTFAVTGAGDNKVIVTSLANGKAAAKLSGHTKKVTGVSFHPTPSDTGAGMVFSCSMDKTVRVWNPAEPPTSAGATTTYSEIAKISPDSNEVSAITVHPTGIFVVSMSTGGTWGFSDVAAATCLRLVGGEDSDKEATGSYLCGKFHPDGLILGTGSSTGAVKVWDVREQKNVGSFSEHSGAVAGLAFSENGYLMASAGTDGFVRIWDLRKLKCTRAIDAGGPASSLAFDPSGLYLAYGGGASSGDVTVCAVKEWTDVAKLGGAHSKAVTGLAWAAGSEGGTETLFSASTDRAVKVHTCTG